MSNSLWLHGLQYVRFHCPSPSSGAYSDSCLLSRWCHPTISSSVVPFSSPALNLSQHQDLFQWVDSSHHVAKGASGASTSASVLPVNSQDWSPLELTGLISLLPKGLSSTTITKASILQWSVHLLRYSNNPGGFKPELGRFPKVAWTLRRIA